MTLREVVEAVARAADLGQPQQIQPIFRFSGELGPRRTSHRDGEGLCPDAPLLIGQIAELLLAERVVQPPPCEIALDHVLNNLFHSLATKAIEVSSSTTLQ